MAANTERVVRSQEIGKKFFFPPTRPDKLCGPPKLPFNWYKRLFPQKVTRSGREVDHSPPFSAKMNKWSYTPIIKYVRQHFTTIFTVIYSSSTMLRQPAIFKCSGRRELSASFRATGHYARNLIKMLNPIFTFHRIIILNGRKTGRPRARHEDVRGSKRTASFISSI